MIRTVEAIIDEKRGHTCNPRGSPRSIRFHRPQPLQALASPLPAQASSTPRTRIKRSAPAPERLRASALTVSSRHPNGSAHHV
jgi:hypothetical protein